MWKQIAATLGMASIIAVASGCATSSGTGVKVRGNEDFQTVTASFDLLEVREVYQNEKRQDQGAWQATVSTVKKPFVWIKENPGKSVLGVLAGVATYYAYEEWIADSGKSKTKYVAKEGYTQNGKNNKITIDGKEGLPSDLVQNGEGNEINFSRNTELEEVEVGAAERVAIKQMELEAAFAHQPEAEEGGFE